MKAEMLKPSDEAMALLKLYNAMKPKTKEGVRMLIIEENEAEEIHALTNISFESWKRDWVDNPEENKMWESFYKKQADV